MCDMYSFPVVYSGDEATEDQSAWNSQETIEDKVILETEITLRTGPNITMKIHEESRSNSVISGTFECEEDSRKQGVIKVLDDDSESDFYDESKRSPKTPRKVRFGGESFKLRTPESDSSHQADDGDDDSSTIKITVTDAISITTRRSLIPVRISSLPSTPKKSLPYPKYSYCKSAPNLTSSSSKIPLRKQTVQKTQKEGTSKRESDTKGVKEPEKLETTEQNLGKESTSSNNIQNLEKEPMSSYRNQSLENKSTPNNGKQNLEKEPTSSYRNQNLENKSTPNNRKQNLEKEPTPSHRNQNLENESTPSNRKQNLEKEPTLSNRRSSVSRQSRAQDRSPIPVHNEIELFHNLTRSPERKRQTSPAVIKNDNDVIKNVNNNENSLISLESAYPLNNNNAGASVKHSEEKQIYDMHEIKTPDEKTYNSFIICKENSSEPSSMINRTNDSSAVIEEIMGKDALTANDVTKPTLQQSLSSLASEDEVWVKSEALESLVKMLKQSGTCESLEAGPAALLLEALFACHHRDRLHSLADDALTILIEGLRPEILEQCLPRLAMALCKMGASSGVRLALVVMKKLSPKKLQLEILGKGFGHRTREGALQILMGCARLYPKPDVEVEKIAEFASSALKDRRRRVRQASLETLAAIAQLSSISYVINIVENAVKNFPDSEDVLQVVRTRLSRKQLPTVDLDGTVRYSSPMDQTETDWISGTVLKNSHVSSSPLSSASSSTPSINYWMHNPRRESNFNSASTLVQQLIESFEEDAFDDPEKVWVTDPVSKNGKAIKGPRGVLRPVYILQPEVPSTSTGRGHRKYDRGRSFSPPKHPKTQYRTGLFEGLPVHTVNNNINGDYAHHERNFVHPDVNSRLQYPYGGSIQLNGGFRKSFSSDQLYFGERLPVKQEPYSYSLSSRSSSTSTGSSTKSGFWQKDFRSGIPVPISDSKLKIRHSSSSSLIPNGPLVAKRSAIPSPQRTPTSTRISPREQTIPQDNDSVSLLSLPLPPPRSSGSESSGYFTPSPPDTHQPAFIKMDTEERLSSDVEEPEAPDSSVNNNSRDCVDSYSVKSTRSEVFLQTLQDEPRKSSISSAETTDILEAPINDSFPSVESININNNEDTIPPRSPSTTSIVLIPSRPSTVEIHRKSKSVVDLQNFLPEINPIRKGTSSAPPRNEENSLNNNIEHISDEHSYKQPITPPSVLTLSSMDYSLQHQDEEVLSPSGVPKSSKLERRFCRSHMRKSLKASPRVVEEHVSRPPSKPKDTLQHVLSQMDSSVWETTVQGLQGLIKLARQHPEVIENQMHQVCLSLAKQVKNLRSQVSRTACSAAGELFLCCKRGLEMELEEIATPLFQRTADTNRFLRADANAALDVMCEQLPVNRVILVVTTRGCGHQNAVVRAAALRLLSDIVTRLGTDRVYQLPKEIRDKLLIAGANSLTDGHIDARTHGKAIYRHLMGHHCFQRCLHDAVPQNILRHISKVLASIKLEI